jgi:threonine dehydratase
MLEFSDIERAAQTLAGVANRTPVLSSRTLNDRLGAELFFKAENLQRGGAFKFRGAYNRLSQVTETSEIVAFSSGNHAQAVALVSRILGLNATIVMPSDAPAVKVAAVKGYGAEVRHFDRFNDDREAICNAIADEKGGLVIPPYDDWQIMAGAGTTGMELFEEVPELDLLVVCIGGGGLIAGCATAAREMVPGIEVVGVEPETANDTALSLAAGERVQIPVPTSSADGLLVATPGELTFEVIKEKVDSVALVSEDDISQAMAYFAERMKIIAEPSGSVGLAALLSGAVEASGRRVGVVISGGNVGLERFNEMVASAER